MASHAHPLIFLSIIVCGSVATAMATSSPVISYCPEDWGTYVTGSTYQSNLKQLVTSLASNASKFGGFFRDSVGTIGSSDQINGLVMCYADAIQTDCLDCLKTVANEIANLSICPNKETAAIHYEACFLHYSTRNFISRSVIQGFQPVCLQKPITNTTGSDFLNSSLVESLIFNLAADASNLEQKYASNKTDYLANKTLYGLVQCTSYLKADECNKCVQESIAYALEPNCSDQFGARIMGPNCYIRYELYAFNVASYMVSQPPHLPVSAPSILPVPPPVPGSRSKKSVAPLTKRLCCNYKMIHSY